MTVKEYIANNYVLVTNSVEQEIDLSQLKTDEDLYKEVKEKNYINTIVALAKLIAKCSGGNIAARNESILPFFHKVLEQLIFNCIIEGFEPRTDLIEIRFGFEDRPIDAELQWILQFNEGYISAATPKSDILYFVELGMKLQLLNLKIN